MSEIFSRALAESTSDEQSAFLNSFYRHLKVCCKGRHESQLSYIADSLDENGREFVKELAQFADLAVETRAKLETAVSELYRQRHDVETEIAALVEQKKSLEEQVSL